MGLKIRGVKVQGDAEVGSTFDVDTLSVGRIDFLDSTVDIQTVSSSVPPSATTTLFRILESDPHKMYVVDYYIRNVDQEVSGSEAGSFLILFDREQAIFDYYTVGAQIGSLSGINLFGEISGSTYQVKVENSDLYEYQFNSLVRKI